MATSVVAGVNSIQLKVDNPERDDLGGMLVWMSTVDGFTPGPANLVYNGPDLAVQFSGLVAGTPVYLRVALYSAIEPASFLTSAQYSATPIPPDVSVVTGQIPDVNIAGMNADKITVGQMRGSNVVAGSFSTKGTSLSAAVLAGVTTVNVKDTADFPASGTAIIYSELSASDRDSFTYTGKTATSFTGCSGVLAHAQGDVVIPVGTKVITLDSRSNEMRFRADRGDGVFSELAVIGIRPPAFPYAEVIVDLGTTSFTGTPLKMQNNGDEPVMSIRVTKTPEYGSYIEPVMEVFATDKSAAKFHTAGGYPLILDSGYGGGAYQTAQLRIAPLFSYEGAGLPTISNTGDVLALGLWDPVLEVYGAPRLYFKDGPGSGMTGFRPVFLEGDTLVGPLGTASLPSFTFEGDKDTGMYWAGGGRIGFASNGATSLLLDATAATLTGDLKTAWGKKISMGVAGSNGRMDVSLHAFGGQIQAYMWEETIPGYGTEYSGILKLNPNGGGIDVGGDISAHARTMHLNLMRLKSAAEVGLASTTHAFQIGEDGSANLVIDTNEVQARSGGAAAHLHLNVKGGDISLGNSTSDVNIGAAFKYTPSIVRMAGYLLVSSDVGHLGYSVGSRGTVTQTGSKAGGVTINKPAGTVVMHAAALAAGARVRFTMTNSKVNEGDIVACQITAGGTANTYRVWCEDSSNGNCDFIVENYSGTSRSEAITMSFAIIGLSAS